jgi:hypothetical protein
MYTNTHIDLSPLPPIFESFSISLFRPPPLPTSEWLLRRGDEVMTFLVISNFLSLSVSF